jgi:hypothetical protein
MKLTDSHQVSFAHLKNKFFLGVIIFGLVRFGCYKKSNQTGFFQKKSKLVQTDLFRFGSVILEQKLVFLFDLVFSGLARFFWFGSVFSISGL